MYTLVSVFYCIIQKAIAIGEIQFICNDIPLAEISEWICANELSKITSSIEGPSNYSTSNVHWRLQNLKIDQIEHLEIVNSTLEICYLDLQGLKKFTLTNSILKPFECSNDSNFNITTEVIEWKNVSISDYSVTKTNLIRMKGTDVYLSELKFENIIAMNNSVVLYLSAKGNSSLSTVIYQGNQIERSILLKYDEIVDLSQKYFTNLIVFNNTFIKSQIFQFFNKELLDNFIYTGIILQMVNISHNNFASLFTHIKEEYQLQLQTEMVATPLIQLSISTKFYIQNFTFESNTIEFHYKFSLLSGEYIGIHLMLLIFRNNSFSSMITTILDFQSPFDCFSNYIHWENSNSVDKVKTTESVRNFINMIEQKY